MTTYRHPDVYIEEISVFPPSVAEVSTAVPAFIGYTEKAEKKGEKLLLKPTKIASLLQYQQYFGGAPVPKKITVELSHDNSVKSTTLEPRFFLYDSVRLFFANGGGECYIASVGDYTESIDVEKLNKGLAQIRKEDEPTILVAPDAVLLPDASKCTTFQADMLIQCGELRDRVALLDVRGADQSKTDDIDEVVSKFRDAIGMNYLKYGAAYFPYLQTNLPVSFRYRDITLKKNDSVQALAGISSDKERVKALDLAVADVNAMAAKLAGSTTDPSFATQFKNVASADLKTSNELAHYVDVLKAMATTMLSLATDGDSACLKHPDNRKNAVKHTDGNSKLKGLMQTLYAYDQGFVAVHGDGQTGKALGRLASTEFSQYQLSTTTPDSSIYLGKTVEADAVEAGRSAFLSLFDRMMTELQEIVTGAQQLMDDNEKLLASTDPVFQSIMAAISSNALTLPPSGAIAGIYAMVDRNRGVWKAPANVSLNAVVAPAIPIDDRQQDSLNVDVQAGKSVNAIRSFAGKGVMVWGARTLAGNDNEWRYISVRRFFNMAEESIKKSTYWAVFEPNDANTWIKVKSMIENYLTQKWRDGALAGAKPADAFFVKIGLGVTMSPQDILDGFMNVEIGMAVVRPAEFIVLKFSHKMQTS